MDEIEVGDEMGELQKAMQGGVLRWRSLCHLCGHTTRAYEDIADVNVEFRQHAVSQHRMVAGEATPL